MSVIARTAPATTSITLRAARLLASDEGLWRPRVDFDPDRRFYTRLLADDEHEAWLLTWLPGQGTDWHDHGGSSGAFVVLQGALVERTARYGIVRGEPQVHGRGGPRAFGSEHVHRMTNEGPDPAVSLHVYAPRLAVQHDYVSDDGILRLVATRRDGEDW